jgi:hypothetical protein
MEPATLETIRNQLLFLIVIGIAYSAITFVALSIKLDQIICLLKNRRDD